jgi:uncharacterized membrane protein
MIWSLSFRLRQYWLGSLWIIPVGCAVIGVLTAIALVTLDQGWDQAGKGWLVYSEGTATALLSAIVTASITFTGFVFTMLLLVPQFGGSQLSARVLHLIYRDPKLKLIFGAFLGTMTYVFVVMSRMRDGFVPGLSLWIGGFLVLVSILLFLAFVSYFVQHLRPATAASSVAEQGRRVIERVYPHPYAGERATDSAGSDLPADAKVQPVRHTGKGGVILAISRHGLVSMAERADCVLVLPQTVGDYVASGSVIVEVIGARKPVFERVLKHLISLGPERTFEQDPAFALRILVDIAAKALSPAINDPTTATHVIDRVEDLLMMLAERDLAVGELRGRSGRQRVVLPSPTWEQFLLLAVTEIRRYGHDSVQVMRRLRSMLLDLADAVPTERVASVHEELRKLDRTIARSFDDEADRALATTHLRGRRASRSESALTQARF